MKIFFLLMIASLFAAICSAGTVSARDYEVSRKAGELNVLIKMNRNPPVVGKNNVEITITDPSGKTVIDARVVVAYSMPPMPGMAPMNYRTDTELRGTVYRATLNYSMPGSWNNEVRITRSGKTVSTRFTIDAK